MRAALAALFVVPAAIAGLAHAQVPVRATTDDNRKVLLYPDGTWKYEGSDGRALSSASARARYRAPAATTKVSLLRGQATFSYNPAKWRPTQSKDPDKTTFQHVNGDGYAMIIAERLEIPLQKLKEIAVANARQAAPNIKVILEEPVKVNGLDVVAMQMQGTIQGIDFIYYGYYRSSPQGSIQVLTYTGRNLFSEFKPDFEEFLNGLEQIAR